MDMTGYYVLRANLVCTRYMIASVVQLQDSDNNVVSLGDDKTVIEISGECLPKRMTCKIAAPIIEAAPCCLIDGSGECRHPSHTLPSKSAEGHRRNTSRTNKISTNQKSRHGEINSSEQNRRRHDKKFSYQS